MTPVRKVYLKNNSGENYNIDDIRSDDSTDDDETPRKKIPSWATGNKGHICIHVIILLLVVLTISWDKWLCMKWYCIYSCI